VCPVIGSFLRTYNDVIDDSRRQDLYAYASMVVGSRGSVDVQRRRADYLTIWEKHFRRNGWVRSLVPKPMRKLARHRHPSLESVGTHAVHAIFRHDDVTHQAVLEAIDHLLALGAEQPPVPAFAPDRRARPRVDATA
jgi:hypothetical protein